ncbi:hypothetical protein [Pendulispora albinea]|uniref:Lipoprotein n=1 Tax=Pendulispora albinea TaxID=2741071 RepID=A0ABZ2LMU6_9BACT
MVMGRALQFVFFFTSGAMGVAACGSSNGDGREGGKGGSDNPKYGSIHIATAKVSGGAADPGHWADADFIDQSSSGPRKRCETSVEGACTVRVCSSSEIPADGGQPKRVHAGIIRIRSAALPSSIELMPNASASYSEAHGREQLWSGGEEIQISADGNPDSVPAFNKTLNAPSLFTLLTPNWSASEDGPTLDRSKDLDLSWLLAGTASGTMSVNLWSAPAGDRALDVTCTYPASDGKAKIPASVLGILPAGRGGLGAAILEKRVVAVSDWEITLLLDARGARANGSSSGGRATFK